MHLWVQPGEMLSVIYWWGFQTNPTKHTNFPLIRQQNQQQQYEKNLHGSMFGVNQNVRDINQFFLLLIVQIQKKIINFEIEKQKYLFRLGFIRA